MNNVICRFLILAIGIIEYMAPSVSLANQNCEELQGARLHSFSKGEAPNPENFNRNFNILKCEIDALKQKAQMFEVIPSGVIVPFLSRDCPKGWDKYTEAAGRVIIGIGKGEREQPYRLEEQGGHETHKLTLAELPQHNHLTVEAGDSGNSSWGVGAPINARHGVKWEPNFPTSYTNYAGQNQPHNNMQPWIALQWCKKQ